MRKFTRLVLPALALLVLGAASASAQVPACARGFHAHAHVAYGNTYDARTAARSRAIGIWKTKVRVYCPDHSAYWWRAKEKAIDCDSRSGGIVCDIYGRPAGKLFH